MNLVGKIFVVLIFVLAFVFLAFSMTLFMPQRNFREVVIASRTKSRPTSRWARKHPVGEC